MKPLLSYYGGKGKEIGDWIANQLPPHEIYVEPFGGMMGVLMAKRPAQQEVYNDLNDLLVNLFEVVRNPVQRDQLAALLNDTPYGRREYERARDRVATEENPVEKARLTYVALGMGFTASLSNKSFSFGGVKYQGNVASTFYRGLQRLEAVSERIRSVVIECQSWEKICPRWDSRQTCFYIDPPYVMSTRTTRGYLHEMTDEQHHHLIEWCIQAKGMVLLSGYDSSIYAPLKAAGWVLRPRQAVAHSSAAAQKGGPSAKRIECLWVNPATKAAQEQQQLTLAL